MAEQTALNCKVGFIGAGQMALALAKGFLSSGLLKQNQLLAGDPHKKTRTRFAEQTGATVHADNTSVVAEADVLIIAVKPVYMATVLSDISAQVSANHLVISIAAGVPLSAFTEVLGDSTRIIRVMPNTPCQVGAGASGFSLGGEATKDDAALTKRMLSTTGLAVEVPESLLDAVTGLSGSGPAYVYQIIEALSDGGVLSGLPRDIATQLAAQTVFGAAKMVLETGEHPGALKDAVTSPGGTTITGIQALEKGQLRGTLINAVQAATKRSQELSQDA